MPNKISSIEWFETLGRQDVARVGGKNASLGEMVRTLLPKGIKVPPGFATTADAYWQYIDSNDLRPRITALVADWEEGKTSLPETGSQIRNLILKGSWPADTAAEIAKSYHELSRRAGKTDADVAVRSSATAEDLPDASFAGQQETFLNIR
ncbi:MAG: PEP/pyruvate-binding domain-containing protein, partial [Devosia sp.]|nr:PEP/pyruvate-binding domain-containing protein [Devosia sp.]